MRRDSVGVLTSGMQDESSTQTRDLLRGAEWQDGRRNPWRAGKEVWRDDLTRSWFSRIQRFPLDRSGCRRTHCIGYLPLATLVGPVRGSKPMKACAVQLTIVALAILSGCYSGSRPKEIGH